jgi:hypothetical protein
MKQLIVIACFLRLFTQMFANDTLYAIGIFGFELLALIYFYKQSEGLIKTMLLFFMGVASFDLIKYIFLNPYKIDYWEYINTIIGILFIFVQYAKTLINRYITRLNNQ